MSKENVNMECRYCLYLQTYTNGNYCSMINRFIDLEKEPVCEKWKRKPRKKPHEEDTWKWVQMEMRIDK